MILSVTTVRDEYFFSKMANRHAYPNEQLSSSVFPSAWKIMSSFGLRSPVNNADVPACISSAFILQTRMHCSRMRTASSLPYPRTETLLPGQRPPWTENPTRERPILDRGPSRTETPWREAPPGQRPPGQKLRLPPWTDRHL